MSGLPVAVIGAGWWATEFHIPGLLEHDDADLVAIVEANPERREAAAHHFGVDNAYASVDELLASGKAEAAVVATPSGTHYEVAQACLTSGVHVMVEKPMVIEPAHAAELTLEAERRGIVLTVGYTYQHTNAAKVAKACYEAGDIGDIVHAPALFASMVEAYYRGTPGDYQEIFEWTLTGPDPTTYSDPKRAGGGQAQTQVTHAIGLQLNTLGQRVRRVYAEMDDRGLPVDIVDSFSYRLQDGAIGGLSSTGNLRPREVHQRLNYYYGDRGYLIHDLQAGTLVAQTPGRGLWGVAGDEVGDPYPATATARHLVDLVTGRATTNLAPGRTATWAVEFLAAARESALSGAAVEVEDSLAAAAGRSAADD